MCLTKNGHWSLYLKLLPEEACQREHSVREVVTGLRSIVKTGAPWRGMPIDLPPRAAGCQQAHRWLKAGCFGQLAHDLRAVLHLAALPDSSPLPRHTSEAARDVERQPGTLVDLPVNALVCMMLRQAENYGVFHSNL
ncbi:Putative transposase of IS4/5 family [Microvirga guangxiensis]|uniref:Putative transposase of IS4/5 family n=1 Tax=Microvirga guangxiensis TaxID=549386 RepID=A0A1G5JT33_9HYPH|nr:Putative transposase of IS4/5 family [Microvirga guangxiensis]